ncbi:MAG: hypothetical protein F9K22_09955 [Bacteroidetes bacterium]|nr:MAG: hypothetical protein F9K22_09955 [Bacteroidota bacterium]
MSQTRTPLDLSGIIEQSLALIGGTFVRNVIIAALFLTLPLILFTAAANEYFAGLLEMSDRLAGLGDGMERLTAMAGLFLPFIVSTLLLSLGSFITETACLQVAAGDLTGDPIGYATAITRTFDGRWLRGLGAEIIKVLAFTGTVIVAGLGAAVVSAAFGGVAGTLSTLLIILLVGIGIPGVLYVVIRWNFSLAAAAIENRSPVDALQRSWSLMEGMWWRTFGILILLWISVEFVTTIVSLPFTFGSMLDVYKEFFSVMRANGGDVDQDLFARLQAQMGSGMGVGIGVTTLLRVTLSPPVVAVVYQDLIVRSEPAAPLPLTPDGAEG